MQENEIILLLAKRLSEGLGPAESEILDAWIAESSENARTAARYAMIWEKSDQVQKTFLLDLDSEFERLKGRLDPAARETKVVPLGFRRLKIAAALILLIATVWVFRSLTDRTPMSIVVAAAASEPKRLLELPDGSRVWLRQNGTLEYPQQFASDLRQVSLTGEAYFEVTHHPKQPFRVNLPSGAQVEVLGTEFNVRANSAADESTVLVREGRVRLSPKDRHDGPVLQANEKAVLNHKTTQIRRSRVSSFNELAWQTGGLEFVKTPLSDVIPDLENFYHVKIELLNPDLRSCKYTAPLTTQPVEQVITSLSLAYHMQVAHPAPGHFVLSGGSCR